MSRAVDKRELDLCISGVAVRSQMGRVWDTKRREAEVQRDAALSTLRVLVEACRTRHCAQRFSEAGFSAVNVT